jgi:hypothetical protein
MVLNATLNKISKGEVEQLFSSKSDKREVDAILRSFQKRLEEDMATLTECLGRKANLDDL